MILYRFHRATSTCSDFVKLQLIDCGAFPPLLRHVDLANKASQRVQIGKRAAARARNRAKVEVAVGAESNPEVATEEEDGYICNDGSGGAEPTHDEGHQEEVLEDKMDEELFTQTTGSAGGWHAR